ncbi:MAG: exodeoxyribonuclease VII large subunit [Campylobacterota bacterium]|nr:exodeoxyribonuclease VII large subunit [Campylobacterota bacterium]
MNSPITVSILNEQIKSLLETTFSNVYVEGEISNLTYHNSGHIYFSIKDEKSNISCVMFRGNAKNLRFRLEVGQKVIISGSLTVYVPRGNYQLLCTNIEPSGTGALALAYEQLKTKLQIKGYFDRSIKKTLPKFPKKIYVTTSNTGAAIEDMKKVLSNRYPLCEMILVPSLVQGEGSKESIVRAIEYIDKTAKDENDALLIVGRGGGSIEDLWSFNEECVADAIYNAKIPIISAVGHESDFVISDFVADIRASTPSNAIEISTPNLNDLRLYLDSISSDISEKVAYIIKHKEQKLLFLKDSFSKYSLDKKFELVQQNIIQTKRNLKYTYTQLLRRKQEEIDSFEKVFSLNEPSKKDKKGFVQLTKDEHIIDINAVDIDDIVYLESSTCKIGCKVVTKKSYKSV